MAENQSEHLLYDQLLELSARTTPFHMPGHKRVLSPAPGLPVQIDLTEITGADNLHHAEGILRDAMDRTARLFGADRTFYLVNGSTVGNLAAIRAAVPAGSEAAAAGPCHRSVLNGLALAGAAVHRIRPERVPGWDFSGSVKPEQIEAFLDEYPDAAAVILTSPTYEGVVSDVRQIADLCHRKGAALIVDEAHGAHLGLPGSRFFPEGAIACGADLVVQSAHKMLPSLTQTALLHVMGDRVPAERVERALSVYETSSPSYPLLCSLDGCTGIIINRGEQLFAAWEERLTRFYRRAAELRALSVYGLPENGTDLSGLYARDPSKILLRAVCDSSITGQMLLDVFSKEYGIEPEMAQDSYVLFMTGLCDTDEMTDRLMDALSDLDELLLAGERLTDYAGCGGSDVVRRNFDEETIY